MIRCAIDNGSMISPLIAILYSPLLCSLDRASTTSYHSTAPPSNFLGLIPSFSSKINLDLIAKRIDRMNALIEKIPYAENNKMYIMTMKFHIDAWLNG